MFQIDSIIQHIRELEHGTARLEALEDAIAQADQASEHFWRINFRYEYIKESVFHDDNFKAILMFPQLLRVFDEHPEFEDECCHDVMWAFKWVLENMPDYYQISKAEIDQYYEEFEQRSRRYGHSLRVYYMKKCKFALTCDREEARVLYDKFHALPRDNNSDCEACEIHFDVSVALAFDELDEAMRIAAPLLDGSKSCAEVPHCTYGRLCHYFLYHGNLEEAEYYGRLCERMTKGEPEFLIETGYLLELWSCLQPAYGWRLMKNSIAHFVRCKNPLMRMIYARGAARLLRQIAKETDTLGSVLLKALPVGEGEDGFSVHALYDYFYGLAQEQCSLLDKRNGSTYYMDLLNTTLPDAPERSEALQDIAAGTKHGLVSKQPCGLMLFPEEGPIPTIETLNKRLDTTLEGVEVVSHSVDGEVLYATVRSDGELHELILTWMPAPEQIEGYPCYGMPEEMYAKIRSAKQILLLHTTLSDHVLTSFHMQLRIAHFLLPGMVAAHSLNTGKLFPDYWVKFAAAFPNAISPEDLVRLQISGCEESDEIWMSTSGLATLGLRELEIIGANRENYGYFADLLHYCACVRVESGMLPDAGSVFGHVSIGEQRIGITWALPEETVQEGSLAAKITRELPAGILMVQPDAQGEAILPTDFAPMLLSTEIQFPHSQQNFVRRIYLSKETFGCFAAALEAPHQETAVRLEFPLSEEMRRQSGYSKELLWAEDVRIENGEITAEIAETSDLLPDISKGDRVSVSPENITSWFIRPQGSKSGYSELEAFVFM